MDSLSQINAISDKVAPFSPLENVVTTPGPLDFEKVFKGALADVNGLDTQSKRMVEALARGDTNDVSGVMLAVRKANMAFLSILQIRNQFIEAYQEIMRMRV